MMPLTLRIELPEEDKRLMRELIKQTLKDRTEHGYLRCGDGTIIRKDGIWDQIDLSEGYQVHGSTALTFHTHPSGKNTIRDMMSASDLVNVRDLLILGLILVGLAFQMLRYDNKAAMAQKDKVDPQPSDTSLSKTVPTPNSGDSKAKPVPTDSSKTS